MSELTAGYRRQSAAVIPGSQQDLAEYYSWRQSRERELDELRQRQQRVERDTLPYTARCEAMNIIRREAIAAKPPGSDHSIKPIPPKIKLPETW